MALTPDRKYTSVSRAETAADIDVGLRSYMLRVYNYMALGVAFTGIISLVVALNPAIMQAVALSGFKWVLFIGIIGLGWFAPRVIMTGSNVAAQGMFWLYAVFFITAAAFAGLSLYGYTTKRDLGPIGSFLAMSTIGLLVAIVANALIFQSSGFHYMMSFVVVLVFAGLTAYETQMIKNWYVSGEGGDVAHRKAVFGAFLLYGSFVTMFVWLLQIFGVARE
jgi:FtsH-binding integral membrane protein